MYEEPNVEGDIIIEGDEAKLIIAASSLSILQWEMNTVFLTVRNRRIQG